MKGVGHDNLAGLQMGFEPYDAVPERVRKSRHALGLTQEQVVDRVRAIADRPDGWPRDGSWLGKIEDGTNKTRRQVMTDGLEELQQAEAKARANVEAARAWAEYESIIGVSRVRSDEMPHPDGTLHTLEERARARAIVEEAVRATERARAAALVEAAQRFKAANEALTRLHEREAVDATNTDAEWAGLVADAWFEHDRARDALYAALAAYQGGASSD